MARLGKSDFIEGRCMSELTLKKKEKTYSVFMLGNNYHQNKSKRY